MHAHGTYGTHDTHGSTHGTGQTHGTETMTDAGLEQMLQEIENGRRDFRAMVFLVGMVSAGALAIVATLLLTGA